MDRKDRLSRYIDFYMCIYARIEVVATARVEIQPDAADRNEWNIVLTVVLNCNMKTNEVTMAIHALAK